MKWIDLPPVWLLVCLGNAWLWRVPASWTGNLWPGVFLLGLAGVLTAAALMEFNRAKTTIVPRQAPAALITGGIYRLSRNPIYVADLLILAGFSLIWGSLPGLLLVPALAWLLQTRFIEGEEARLAETFGDKFANYAARTRRWI